MASDPAAPARLPLSQLAEGEQAQVVRVDARGRALAKLLAMGILPGVEVCLVQSRPMPVIQMGYTTVALDRELAGMVEVARLSPAGSSSPGSGRPHGQG
ncbi:MAG TPA: FeoA family protein [Limnochorda sp.]